MAYLRSNWIKMDIKPKFLFLSTNCNFGAIDGNYFKDG